MCNWFIVIVCPETKVEGRMTCNGIWGNWEINEMLPILIAKMASQVYENFIKLYTVICAVYYIEIIPQ